MAEMLRDAQGISMKRLRLFEAKCCACNSGCIEWSASRDHDGYGRFWIGHRVMKAHRFSWVVRRGPVPEGLQVLHHCDNRACVNVEHLFLGTAFDNMADMWRKGRHGVSPQFIAAAKRDKAGALNPNWKGGICG